MAEESDKLGPVDFSTFIVSLGGNVMVHLGEVPSEGGASLDLAKQTIDILEVLKDKTRGNLDEEEQELLDTVLYKCRVGYVEASKKV